jgi:hypothetical protein
MLIPHPLLLCPHRLYWVYVLFHALLLDTAAKLYNLIFRWTAMKLSPLFRVADLMSLFYIFIRVQSHPLAPAWKAN